MDPLEGNKLIAEFDGWYQKERTGYGIHSLENPYYRNNDSEAASIHGFKYHTSWDWLMPVVEKIEAMDIAGVDCSITIMRHECKIYYDDTINKYEHGVWVQEKKITAVWQSIISFIQWYNITLTSQ